MTIAVVEEFLKGKFQRLPSHPYHDYSRSNGLDCFNFKKVIGNLEIYVEVYETIAGTVWPDYPCGGNTLSDRFAAHYTFCEKPGHTKTVVCSITDGFLQVNRENLEKHLGEFVR